MNYRHAYHAGNFADVLKHTALFAILRHLRKKPAPFAVIDAHGGAGLYDLGGAQAVRTGEAARGIVKLLQQDDPPGVLAPFCALVRTFGATQYPGSPLIAASQLRSTDRLIAIERHPEDYRSLATTLAGAPRARTVAGDFKALLPSMLPLPERRGLVLVDPAYEEEGEFTAATHAIVDAHRRFATGIFAFWYPAKARPLVAASAGEFLTAGVQSLLQLELDIGSLPGAIREGRSPPLSVAGLLVINPPYGLAEEMELIMPYLAETLAQGPNLGKGVVEVLASRG